MREFHRSSSLLFKVFLKVVLMWGKRRDMTVRDRLPFNAEPPASVLAGRELTALDAFYCRNHGPFPEITGRAVATDRRRHGAEAADPHV